MTDPETPKSDKSELLKLETAEAGSPELVTEGGLPPVLLKGEIEIFPGARLSHLDAGPIKAYSAKTRTREKAFALVCEKNIVPQIFASSKYYGLSSPALPRLVGAGTVDWTPLQQQRYVYVYENKLGMPIANSANINGMDLKNDLVLNTVIRNLVPALKDMRDADFVHGNIRVQNLFNGGGNGLDKVILGECLAAPQGYLQPVLYETIERGVSNPLGRGAATYEDDMYAFGVTLAILLRNHDPMAGFTDEEIIAEKIENGSYSAITGKERFTGSLLECLRGLLNDDPRQRWTIDDVITWMEGRRVHPKQGAQNRLKASRPLDFNQEKYLRPQLLALDFHKNPKEVVKIAEGNELKQWLNRSLQDKVVEDRCEEALTTAQAQANSGSYPEKLACYLSIALAPGMPMQFRGLSFMPEAMGRMMVNAYVSRQDLNPYVDVIQNQMTFFWSSSQEQSTVDLGEVITKFDTCRAFLRHQVSGYGLERCVYFLCQESPCLSEKLKDYYVRSAEDLLAAFEKMASSSDRPETFFDRHIVAFLSVRDRQIIDPYIPDLNAEEKYRNVLANLRILSAIQKRAKLPDMPGVAGWLIDTIDPLINRFHDRDTRANVRAQLQKMRAKGDLSKISAVFDNVQIFQDDFSTFKGALKTYYALRQEYNDLQQNLETNKSFGHGMGRQIAAAFSGAVAGLIIIAYLVFKVSSGGGF